MNPLVARFLRLSALALVLCGGLATAQDLRWVGAFKAVLLLGLATWLQWRLRSRPSPSRSSPCSAHTTSAAN